MRCTERGAAQVQRTRVYWSAVLALALAIATPLACGTEPSGGGSGPDTGADTPEAGPSETGATPEGGARDAVADASVDAPSDAPVDASVDAPNDAPVDAPSDAPGDAAGDATVDAPVDTGPPPPPPPLVFSVMGDVPYTAADEPVLQAQIVAHNAMSPSKFMVHVGDIKSGSAPCVEPTYQKVAGFLHALTVPTFIIPGDNEWNDCTDPAQAWGFWTTHFGHFEAFWPAAPVVARQAVRDENFAWVDSGVLMVGINLVGGAVHSAAEWALRLPEDAAWISEQLALHGDKVYAMVLFAHAEPTANHTAFMTPYRAAVGAWGKPVLHLMGDGHVWKMDRPYAERNILRVEVQQGGVAQPIQVTVSPADPNAFAIDRAPY